MAKLNVNKKSTINSAIRKSKTVIKNKAGGIAFKFGSAAEYLLGTIGSAMFVEPKYYKDTENLEELKNRRFSTEGLDEQAVKIINACIEVTEGDYPRDLLALAHWARVEMNMRTTPQVMLAVAASCEKTKPFVRKYVSHIARRADDVKQVVGAYEHLFGWNGFPACLKKGVSDRMSKMSEYEILKYNSSGHPSFKDLLRFCERRKDYPFSKPIRDYILTREITNPGATPMIAARKELTSCKNWSDSVPALAKTAGVTWEVLISQFGSSREVWEAVMPQMGYMALLRNLRNFLKVGMSSEACRRVASKLADREAVLKSKQLPFRFLAAYRTLYPDQTNWYYSVCNTVSRDHDAWDKRNTALFIDAVEVALDHAVENVPVLPGVTYIAADNSGSMDDPISEKSVMTIKDAANVLCAIIHRQSEDSIVCAFGNNVVFPPLTKRNSVITNANKVATYQSGHRGQATNAFKVIEYLLEKNIKVDRIIVLSDMQCYDIGNVWSFQKSVVELLTKYRRKVNPNAYAHFFDLKGYGSRQTKTKDGLSNVVAGFSEKIFDQILMFEGEESANGRQLPTIEYVRENY